jgi:hypothetical protein
MFNFGISSGWRVVVSCTEIRSTHPGGVDTWNGEIAFVTWYPRGLILLRALYAQINVQNFSFATRHDFKGLHNMLNGYYDIYITKTNREAVNTATTEMEMRKKEKSGDSRGIVVWMDRSRLRKSKEKRGG